MLNPQSDQHSHTTVVKCLQKATIHVWVSSVLRFHYLFFQYPIILSTCATCCNHTLAAWYTQNLYLQPRGYYANTRGLQWTSVFAHWCQARTTRGPAQHVFTQSPKAFICAYYVSTCSCAAHHTLSLIHSRRGEAETIKTYWLLAK